jgi:hypothetical protein
MASSRLTVSPLDDIGVERSKHLAARLVHRCVGVLVWSGECIVIGRGKTDAAWVSRSGNSA